MPFNTLMYISLTRLLSSEGSITNLTITTTNINIQLPTLPLLRKFNISAMGAHYQIKTVYSLEKFND